MTFTKVCTIPVWGEKASSDECECKAIMNTHVYIILTTKYITKSDFYLLVLLCLDFQGMSITI
jgi:hypothetical protein